MGKLKNIKYGNTPFDEDFEDYIDDDYHYDQWLKEQKRKKTSPSKGDEDDFDGDL